MSREYKTGDKRSVLYGLFSSYNLTPGNNVFRGHLHHAEVTLTPPQPSSLLPYPTTTPPLYSPNSLLPYSLLPSLASSYAYVKPRITLAHPNPTLYARTCIHPLH